MINCSSYSALVGESFLNKPFCLFLVNFKATNVQFLNVSEKTQFYVKFLWRLYTQDLQFATVVDLKIPPDFHFLGVCLSLSVGICWFL